MLKYLIPEGKTEINIIKQLNKKKFINFTLEEDCNYPKESEPGGKSRINSYINSFGTRLGIDPLRYLILRDLDEHDNETFDTIKQSIENAIKKLFEVRGFSASHIKLKKSDNYANIYTFSSAIPDFKLSLHIADFPKIDDNMSKFIKSTTDDYILRLIIKEKTMENLYNDLYKNKSMKPDSPDIIKQKVIKEVRELLGNNKIIMEEAKDFIRIYSAITRTGLSPAAIVNKIINHSCDEDIKEVFISFIWAVNYLSEEN